MNVNDRKFIFHDLQKIEGYIDPPDALVFSSLLHAQKRRSLGGGIAEIGVFYGRSYFLLRRVAGEDAPVLAVDLFDLDDEGEGLSQYERFLENGKKLNLKIDQDLVIQGDSTLLTPEEVIDKVGKVRFFSIDGGHMLNHVLADSALAMDVLDDHGIIVFDDTFNPQWPEVTVGVADFLRTQGDCFSAFCMTKYKTYVCRREYHDFYENAVTQSQELGAFDHVETEFLGSRVTRLHNPMGRRMIYELMIRSGLTNFSERIYR
ncbi:class I SAM-dependent methyltransferase [Agrobacterium larrymoorei]|uniref:Class I SAM-dependent methyltransferase n=1 Tax=Agrobacterium larrymoorei TaxID=160699 RepID=A0AAF0HCL4_9HYPH|nr:class I SAM-dependent methyltransferase [Agrobacterium larrymoorei]WHA41856.1 class I SAM-dependent methyltransferase [Agrobacterium larrymoorei]